MAHTLEICKSNIHIKAYDERKSRSFECKCCFYTLEAIICPNCNSPAFLKQISIGKAQCENIIKNEICGTEFDTNLDIIEPEPKNMFDELLNETEEKHEHEKGFRSGFINRDHT